MPVTAPSSIPWWKRPGVWAIALAIVVVAINLVSMGSAGAWDPWETHYGEVARQILVRHDPIDLWWEAGNGGPDATAEKTFWSKPALPFWLMALSMKIFGVGTSADPTELVQPWWPELALRMPSMLAGMASAALLGFVAWRQVSPRAGILTALVLVTMPQWAIASRQALTDMIFVGPVVLAIGAWILAWGEPDRPLRTRGRGLKRVPWDRAYLGFVLVFLVAAVAPLAVIHQHSFDPGTWATLGTIPKHAASLREIQVHMFVYWALAVVVLVASLRWTRRSQAWMGILYLAAGLSLLGKGLIGPGLVGAVVLMHLIVTGRWDLLLRCGLPTGIALFALASFPWHHAMVLFRGERWVNELIIQNNLARFGSGEQKQAVGSFAFYLETLGMAALPWVCVLPLTLASAFAAFRRKAIPEPSGDRDEPEPAFVDHALAHTPEQARRTLHRFALLWLAVTLFALGYSVTKYYHYLIPALPPLALLTGLWIDEQMRERPRPRAAVIVGSAVALAVLVAVVRDAFNTTAWLAHLTTYLYTGLWRSGGPAVDVLPYLVAPFGLGLLAWAAARYRVAVSGVVVWALLSTGGVFVDYQPAAAVHRWQRRAMR
ncbi:MAG: hypothetical protein AB1Z98_33625, partial [Nannocystaceae bacterium]